MEDDLNPYRAGAANPPEPAAVEVGGPMTVAYSMEIEDVVAFHLHHNLVSASTRRARRLRAALGLGLMLLAALLFWSALSGLLAFVLLACGVAFLLLGNKRMMRSNLAGVLARHYADDANRKFLGPRTVSIGPDGVRHRSDLVEVFWRWGAVHRIDVAREHLIIYVSTTEGLVVPQRAFGSRQHYEAFLATARQFLAAQ